MGWVCRNLPSPPASFGGGFRSLANFPVAGVSPESFLFISSGAFSPVLSFGAAVVSGQVSAVLLLLFSLLPEQCISRLGSRGCFPFALWFYFFWLRCTACYLIMYVSVRVEGKVLEVSGGVGGLFPFKVAEASRRKRSFIRLSFQEFRWLAV